ncbi:MAG TPA: nitrogenase component 1 [Negativicutes bacterium]|nr:nitrogenase component 1 [Negativicutes bacterium]
MNLRNSKTPPIREKRLNSVQAYFGDIAPLLTEFQQNTVRPRIRTFSQASVDDIISVLQVISGIHQSVAIIHGPRGCAASRLSFERNGVEDSYWTVTDLNERDTIIGAEKVLCRTVVEMYRRYRPQVIFIVATPVVAINNDDILSVVEELREELKCEIVPIFSDGFKSKIGATGFDVLAHALVKYLPLERSGEPAEFINLLATTENGREITELQQLLTQLGLQVNLLPRLGSMETISRASHARISVTVNRDESNYLATLLQDEYGVPALKMEPPIGIDGTSRWLQQIGEATGNAAGAAELAGNETRRIKALIQETKLENKRVYISASPAIAVAIGNLVRELGGKMAGVTVEYIDSTHQEQLQALQTEHSLQQLHVAQGQPFEVINILKLLKPDLFIGEPEQAVWAARLGIPVVSLSAVGVFGYEGVLRFSRQVAKALNNGSFVSRLAATSQLPYKSGWYQKSVNWYIKQEVK